jgi:heme-degrading monooxygenase HmoA
VKNIRVHPRAEGTRLVARLWETGIDESRRDEYDVFAETRSLPMFKRQPGFVGVVLMERHGRRMVLTVWESDAAADALEQAADYRSTVAALEALGLLVGDQAVTRWHIGPGSSALSG